MDTMPMPMVFVGHGDPMNALRDNEFTRALGRLGRTMTPRPRAILCISAHWLTRGTWFCTNREPETIHDFGGFPEALYKVQYPAPGEPDLALEAMSHFPGAGAEADWGLDHGAWTVLMHMYPKADIPVFQMSIDYHKDLSWHFAQARHLAALRREGVLIVGSGNIVHNLRASMAAINAPAFPWNRDFDAWTAEVLDEGRWEALTEPYRAGACADMAVPTPDHYIPLLYVAGLALPDDRCTTVHEDCMSGISMRSIMLRTGSGLQA